jgi:hypothetical protein
MLEIMVAKADISIAEYLDTSFRELGVNATSREIFE